MSWVLIAKELIPLIIFIVKEIMKYQESQGKQELKDGLRNAVKASVAAGDAAALNDFLRNIASKA